MDVDKPPLVFANRAIRRLVNNQFSDDVLVVPDDYMVMRVVYRRCNGSWEKLARGDVHHTLLLSRIVKAWGKIREKKRKVEVSY